MFKLTAHVKSISFCRCILYHRINKRKHGMSGLFAQRTGQNARALLPDRRLRPQKEVKFESKLSNIAFVLRNPRTNATISCSLRSQHGG
jgi:hypothetical protein